MALDENGNIDNYKPKNNPYWLICYWGREKDLNGKTFTVFRFHRVINEHPLIYINNLNKKYNEGSKGDYVLTSIHKMSDQEVNTLLEGTGSLELDLNEYKHTIYELN